MARTLNEIYNEAKNTRDKYLERTEYSGKNSSKMSILDAFTWVVSACIWTHENLFDVFKVNLAEILNNRINGTPAYFANAILKYQAGDQLLISDDGTKFTYANIDPSKRIVSKVSYSEVTEPGFLDKSIVLKIAKGNPGDYSRISVEDMVGIQAYINSILFAGQHALVVSRNGDILIPKVTVYYDGEVTKDEVYSNIEEAIKKFIKNISFDGAIYTQKLIDAIQSAEHVTDIQIEDSISDKQGIFIAQYDDDNNIIVLPSGDKMQKVGRYFVPNSGYVKESTKQGVEAEFPKWRESIVLKLEDRQ